MTRGGSDDGFERIIRILSIAAVAAIVASLMVSGVRARSGPPDLSVSVQRQGERSGGTAYEVRVRNDGGETAENVEVEVTVAGETKVLSVNSVARRDEESGVVVFPLGTDGPATAKVVSYSETAR